MAKVNVEFDTKSKELTVSMDGTAIPNVMGVSVNKSYYSEGEDKEEYGCSILTLDKKKDDGYQTYTQIVASESADGKALKEEGANVFATCADFVVKAGQTLTQIVMRKVFNRKK